MDGKLSEAEKQQIAKPIMERLASAGLLNAGDTVDMFVNALVRGLGEDERSREFRICIERRAVTNWVRLAPRAEIMRKAFAEAYAA